MAAEKKGLYRIDVARDGRVRLTARDGGRARIYSETSGFTLRDGRTAELIFEGVDAGDWELLAAGPSDSWDSWIDDRERYLAQRLRYDNNYYDDYVWGAEDLDAYGTWAHVDNYGWIWRPHVTIINNHDGHRRTVIDLVSALWLTCDMNPGVGLHITTDVGSTKLLGLVSAQPILPAS